MQNPFDTIKKFFESLIPKEDHYEVVIRSEDTLYDICKELTGDGDRWAEAVPLNPGRDLDDISAGDTVAIPKEWLGQ